MLIKPAEVRRPGSSHTEHLKRVNLSPRRQKCHLKSKWIELTDALSISMFFRLYGQHIVLIGICYLARVVPLLREIMVLIYLTRLCSVIFLPIQPCIFWGSSNNNGLFFSINLYKRIIFGFSVCFFSTIAFRKFKTRHFSKNSLWLSQKSSIKAGNCDF